MRTSISAFAVLLPVIAFGLIALNAAARLNRLANAAPWREAMLAAAVVCGTVLAGITEFLSLGKALTAGNAAAGWSLLAAGAAVPLFRRPRLPSASQTRDPALIAMLAAIGAIVLIAGITAAVAAPNNWDSMTYHLPRCVHWILNRSVAPYATHIPRQLFREPGAEYAITQVMLLTGGDRWVNLVQWGCWVGCLIAISLVTRELGGSARTQATAALFAATLPIAILEASSTQNDLVLAFWLCSLAFFAVKVSRGATASWAIGASLGLAVLTKGTAYLYAAPLVLWIAVSLWRRCGRRVWRPVLVIGAVAAAINVGHWSANVRVFGKPVGPEGNLVSRTIDPRIWISNVVRNSALEFAIPYPAWNRAVERGVSALHRAMGVGENDPRSTYPGARFQLLAVPSGEASAWTRNRAAVFLHEDHAPNPLHAVLLLAAFPLLFASRRVKGPVRWYAAAILCAFLFFSIALRWQPWHSRLHLPVLILAAPVFAVAAEGWRAPLRWAMCALLAAAAVPALLDNTTRPLVGPANIFQTARLDQYLGSKPELLPSYREAARVVARHGWTRLGLVSGGDAGEYPLRMFLGGACALEAVGVRNQSRILERPADPQAILYLASPDGSLPFEPEGPSLWSSGVMRIVAAQAR